MLGVDGRVCGNRARAALADPFAPRAEAVALDEMKSVTRLFVVLSLVLTAACGSDEVELPTLAETVKQRIAAQDRTPVSLAEATGFPWDRVHIFGPYTSYEEVLRPIGGDWDDVRRTGIEHRDDATLLVFVRAGEVAAFAMYPRRDGDLAEAHAPTGLTPEQALFVARRAEMGGPWVVLELVDGPLRKPGSVPSRGGAGRENLEQ